jgi:hypothetical protein
MKNKIPLAILFFLLLFLCRYIDFFLIYQPLQRYNQSQPTLQSFILFNYILNAIVYFLQCILISLILLAGIFLEGKTNKDKIASFGSILLLVISSELVFLTEYALKFTYFLGVSESPNIIDYEQFFPLSLYQLLDYPQTSIAYLMKKINLFELVYIICLSVGLTHLQYNDLPKSITVVLSSYGLTLFAWSLIVMSFQ